MASFLVEGVLMASGWGFPDSPGTKMVGTSCAGHPPTFVGKYTACWDTWSASA